LVNVFDKDKAIKEQAGVKNLNKYSNYYEVQTICSMFPALTPEAVWHGDDAFYTKHLLSSLEKNKFESMYFELKQKQKK